MTILRSSQLILVLLVESTLLYTVMAILGGVLKMGGSSLNPVAIFTILGLSCLASLYFQNSYSDPVRSQIVSFGMGLLVLYIAVGMSVESPVGVVGEYAWIFKSFNGDYEYVELGRQVLGMVLGVGIWSRGMSIAATYEIDNLLFRSFRIGSIVVTFGAVVDALFPIWLGMEWVAPGFFLSGLLCLVLMQFDSYENGAMVRISWLWLGLSICVILVTVGVAFTFTVGGSASDLAQGVVRGIGVGVTYVLLALAIPMLYVADWAINSLFWILDWVLGEGWQAQVGGVVDSLRSFEQLRGENTSKSEDQGWFMSLLKWAIVCIFLCVVLAGLFFSYVVGSRRRKPLATRSQEGDDRGVGDDIWNLFKKLIPEGIGVKRSGGDDLPQGSDSRATILRTYYKILERGEANGFIRPTWQTSIEYHRSTLTRILPADLGLHVTSLFNQARYNKQSEMRINATEATKIEQECESHKDIGLA